MLLLTFTDAENIDNTFALQQATSSQTTNTVYSTASNLHCAALCSSDPSCVGYNFLEYSYSDQSNHGCEILHSINSEETLTESGSSFLYYST